jgi:hypothetical protein
MLRDHIVVEHILSVLLKLWLKSSERQQCHCAARTRHDTANGEPVLLVSIDVDTETMSP